MAETTDLLRQRVMALCPDWDPGELSGFLYLEGGYSNHNYRFSYGGDRYVLRTPFTGRPEIDRQLEQALYRGPAAACMPELIALDPQSGDMISRWVPGALLADREPDSRSLVAYVRHLHDSLPPVERRYDPLAHARTLLARADAPAWLQRLAATQVWQPDQAVTCHNDLNPWNVILTHERDWVTLDWEWVGRNDPLFDLVTLHQGADLDAAALQTMARQYLGAAADPARLQRCLTVFWLRETSWALAELAAGNDRPEVTAQRDLGYARLQALS